MSASAAPSTAGSGRAAVASRLLPLRSDDQLIAAFRGGQDAAFQVIHDRYRPRLFAYARQMLGGTPQDSEDALQDVFLRAYHTLRTDERPITLRAWLYRVAHNRCIDEMRRPAPTPVEASEDMPSAAVDPLVAAQQREDLRRLVADIGALPEQQRSALLMREMDGMSYAELSAVLGVTVPAVKSLLVRARMGLAEAGEARDAACQEIRADLASSHDRGVRSSARARRHMRECHGCGAYRVSLTGASAGIAALTPASPGLLAGLAHALGLGGAGSGALVAGTGGAGTAGSSAAAVGLTTTKVAAVLGAAAVAAGGATHVHERIATGSDPVPMQTASPPPAAPSTGPIPDSLVRSQKSGKEHEDARGDGEDSGGADAGGNAPGHQVAQGPGGAGGGAGAASGDSGGGGSSSGTGEARPRKAKRSDRPVDAALRVPGEVVGGVLGTVRRTRESVSGGSGDGSAGTTGQAASKGPDSPPERRPRGAEPFGG